MGIALGPPDRPHLVLNGPICQNGNHVMGTCMEREDAAVLHIAKNGHMAIQRALGGCGFALTTNFGWTKAVRRYVVWRDPLDRYPSSVVQAWKAAALGLSLDQFIRERLLPYHDIHCAPQWSFVNGPIDEFVPFDHFPEILTARLGLPAGIFQRVQGTQTSPEERETVPVDEDVVRWLYGLDFAVWEGIKS